VKIRAVLVAVLVGTAALAAGGPAAADPNNDKARVDRQLAQAQSTYEAATTSAQAALQAFSSANAQLPSAQEALAVAQGVVAARHVAASEAERAANAARVAQAAAHERYGVAATKVDAARKQVGDFVAAAYRGGGLLAVSSLLESQTPGDFLDRVGYLDQVAQSQRYALNGYLDTRLVAKQADDLATAARRKADAAEQAARDALAAAQAAQAQAQQAQTTVTGLVTVRSQAMATANAQRDATLAQYNQVKAESDRIAEELRRLAANDGAKNTHGSQGSSAPVMRGGYFLTPVHGWKSSDFGMRFDPYYHVWQLHAGVDLAAGGGTPIYAAADGRVVRAGWNGGYGNYTCIYHGLNQGRGISTCYGHQSAILVHVGQQVHRGDVIGRVGTTGASTGNHLHFEVRINGTPVQPLNWLAACLC
jgi:murein DD-endopeptidase MepM/ murein hydrolase activator NlpD